MVTMLILRLIHILTGVFWAGSMFFLAGQIWRAVDIDEAAGLAFMERLMLRARGGMAMAIAGGLNVLSGIGLYGLDSGGFQPAWSSSPVGMTFGIGGLAGILALVVGMLTGRAGERLGNLIVATQGGAAAAANATELTALRDRVRVLTRAAAALLGIAVIAMAIARYV